MSKEKNIDAGWQRDATILEFPRSHANESVFLFDPKPELDELQLAIAGEVQAAAVEALPAYEVKVVKRSTHKEPETTKLGTRFQETVRFSDGAVRLLDRYVPDPSYFGAENISSYDISATDALGTGPDGFNRKLAETFFGLGYGVDWLHHQGRHSILPTNWEHIKTMARFLSSKDVGKSAHHQHALIDHLGRTADEDKTKYVKIGDSRSGMEGEAEEALAPLYGHEVLWGDYIASCFEHELQQPQLARIGLEQVPKEAAALGRIVLEKLAKRDFKGIVDLAGTFDPHPLNMMHEFAWIRPLINGDTGVYARAVPMDALGVRTHLSGDIMSQYEDFKVIHSVRRGIHVQQQRFKQRDLMHIDLVREEVQDPRLQRFRLLLQYMQTHNMSLSGLTLEDIVPQSQFSLAA